MANTKSATMTSMSENPRAETIDEVTIGKVTMDTVKMKGEDK